MAVFFTWMFRLLVLMASFLCVCAALFYYVSAKSLPNYSKTVDLPALASEIEIVRDTFNVPHITSQSDRDVFYGLGYVHAQDRLWQLFNLRRKAQGKLAEVYGMKALESDQFYRRLDLQRLSQLSLASLSAEAQDALRAYADGINARLYEINKYSLGRGAPEFFFFNAPFPVWSPTDSLAILKLLAIQWSDHLPHEIQRVNLLLALDDLDRMRDIDPEVPSSATFEPDQAFLFQDLYGSQFASSVPNAGHSALFGLPLVGLAGASNAYAARPKRSTSDATLLANDPHGLLEAPSLWYLSALHFSDRAVMGATVPGIPLVLSGRSDVLGWGITASYIDDADLYIEELSSADPNFYRSGDTYKPFETRQSIISIKDNAPLTLTLRHSENGPVLPRSLTGLASVTPANHVVSLRSTALGTQDTSFESFLELMRSDNIASALEASERFQAPSLNITLADTRDIALKTIGLRPLRSQRHETMGRHPSRGWVQDNRWLGFLDDETAPLKINPPKGLLANTNNKVTDGAFPDHGSYRWGDSQRIKRLSQLLGSRKIHTLESFQQAQLDTISYPARTLLPLVGSNVIFNAQSAEPGTLAYERKTALDLLAEWSGEMNEYEPQPLIYNAWMKFLQMRLVQDELSVEFARTLDINPLFIERVFRNVEGASIWCDVVQSSQLESCLDMAELSLDDALYWLRDQYGGSLSLMRWGDAHQAVHKHPSLGDVPLLKYLVNIVQPTSGGSHTLQRAKFLPHADMPFQNIHAAGYRGLYDFADPNSSQFVISTGQSGHPLSKHYDDLGELWRRGEYWTMSLELELARAASVGVTYLRPLAQED